MFIVLVFIHMMSGQIVPRTSVVIDRAACEESIPLFVKLYKDGKFEDGPPPEKIKSIDAICVDSRRRLRGSS